ncbi:MacS family sensor histidine kinase [Enemella sp. A6]|uniref:MacS family sensor histidine kinase n=1 Tax=Enemella sp. A6 TaxID=3440152 RepID=UPI003EBC377C
MSAPAPATPAPREFEETPVFKAHTALRSGMLMLAARNLWLVDGHRLLLIACFAFMVAWTLATAIAYARTRPTWLLAADFGVTLALVLCSPWVVGPHSTVPDLWIAGAPMAIALWRGWVPGTIAAGSLAVVASVVAGPSTDDIVASMMTVIGCACLGYLVEQLRCHAAELRVMTAQRAAMAERQRLARIVHDGVLQVLALVEREGRNLGPRGQWLAKAAHEQESALRALLQEQAAEPDEALIDVTRRNLSSLLDRHAGPGVTISTPAETVLVEATRAQEIEAAVQEALNNVNKHAGTDAQAWVLLEREGDELVIGIRDNGRGAQQQDFDSAVERGRMGMKHSIHGRIAELGGYAKLRTAPGRGVEWEFRIPMQHE